MCVWFSDCLYTQSSQTQTLAHQRAGDAGYAGGELVVNRTQIYALTHAQNDESLARSRWLVLAGSFDVQPMLDDAAVVAQNSRKSVFVTAIFRPRVAMLRAM